MCRADDRWVWWSAMRALRCYGGVNVACRRWRIAIFRVSPKIGGGARCRKGLSHFNHYVSK
eukprot:scaffold217_cov64-Cyclotella_meneghiniana.AAC.4